MSSPTARRIRIVCISDTHNDDPTAQIPDGDVFIHAGDMTNHGTPEELETAIAWIRKLPHKLKILIAGNHDMGLDPLHKDYNEKSHQLFTDPSVRENGIVYLDPTQPRFLHDDILSIYANPTQPDYLKRGYAFTYKPYPLPDATAAWESAPDTRLGPIDLWVAHGPPKGHLDNVGFPLNLYLEGCTAQLKKITAAKPSVCVFGHYHYSHGVERVMWREGDDLKIDKQVATSKMLTGDDVHDLTDLKLGKETVFINAAWMTALGTHTKKRNKPIAFDLAYVPSSE